MPVPAFSAPLQQPVPTSEVSMRHNPSVRLSGDRNECPGCGQLFNSSAAFDKHRTGTFTPAARRCVTNPEMIAKGMARNASGFWVGTPMPAGREYAAQD